MPSISLSAVPVTQESTLEAPPHYDKEIEGLKCEKGMFTYSTYWLEESNVIINQ